MYFKWFKSYESVFIYCSLMFCASCNILSTNKSTIEYKIETIQTRPIGGVAIDKKDNVYLFTELTGCGIRNIQKKDNQ